MGDRLTMRELSERSGEPAESLLEWRSLGLVGGDGREDFAPEDVERARLVQLLLRRGIDLAAIASAEREIGFLASYMDAMFVPGPGPTHTVEQASEVVGLDPGQVRRFAQLFGVDAPGDSLHDEDVQALRMMRAALDAGFPEEALLQVARVYADALGRVAEAESRLFHFYVHERLRDEGLSGLDLVRSWETARDQLRPLIEPMLLYFHHKGMQRAIRDDAVLHLQDNTGLHAKADAPGRLRTAIVFVDLSSFTPLAEVMGDPAAAEVLAQFSRIVREAVGRSDGRVVKQLGDAFMLVFSEPRSAVACALEIEARSAAEPQFPAVRSGAHWGQVLYREGDYLGTAVNVAARVAAEATRHQVLLTAALRQEAGGLPGVELLPLGKRRLKGLTDELELFEAVQEVHRPVGRRLIDPVCGMELGAGEAAATLSLEGRERGFCSQACLQRFVAAPERYPG